MKNLFIKTTKLHGTPKSIAFANSRGRAQQSQKQKCAYGLNQDLFSYFFDFCEGNPHQDNYPVQQNLIFVQNIVWYFLILRETDGELRQ